MLDYLVVLAEYKRTIAKIVGVTIVAAIVLFFLILSRWYKSVATVMPPKEKSSLSLLTSISKAAAPLRSLGLGAQSDEISQFLTILNSRRVAEAVIRKFDLQKVYKLADIDKTIKELEGNVSFTTGKEDVSVDITVYDTDPQRAADMANYYVDVLNNVYQQMSATEAKGNREFIEKRYVANVDDLAKAEDNLRSFQKKYHVYSIPDQVKGAVEAAAAIQSQIALKEVQLGLLKRTTTADNIQQQTISMEIDQLRKQLNVMNTGEKSDTSNFAIFAPFSRAPDIGIEYLRAYRELELQNKIMELILPLLEEAKIEEQRDTPAVLVLDKGVPAIRHSKPKRLTYVLLCAAASFLLTYLVCLYLYNQRSNRASLSDTDLTKLAIVRNKLSFKNIWK